MEDPGSPGLNATGSSYSFPAADERPSHSVSTLSHVNPSSPSPKAYTTGILYDQRMFFHQNLFRNRVEKGHPEDPRRITAIYDHLYEADCLGQCLRIDARPATREELRLFHKEEHLDQIDRAAKKSLPELLRYARMFDSVYLNNATPYCAQLSCGGAIELCVAVASGKVSNGMAVIRPPGHHAECDQPMGFCIYNNVVVATRCLQLRGLAKRVMILDWDVHHGNGTQRAFIHDPDVLYISVHRHEYGKFFPYTDEGSHDKIGVGDGIGRNVNIPWPSSGMKDSDYAYAMEKVVIPIGREFSPDLVIISAGFDAAAGDPIGGCFVTPSCYGWMTKFILDNLAGGRVAMVLEGGYNLESTARCSVACVQALLQKTTYYRPEEPPSDVARNLVHLVIETNQPYWECMRYYPTCDYAGASVGM